MDNKTGITKAKTPDSLKVLGVMILTVCSFALGIGFQNVKTNKPLVPLDFGVWGSNRLAAPYQELPSEADQVDSLNIEDELFWSVWKQMRTEYVDPEKYDEDQMMYGAIKGMVESYDDPATAFFDPEETSKFNEEKAGKYFEGIGAELGYRDGLIVVVAPIDGSPAQAAGLLAGDIIQKVDGEEVKPSETIFDVVMRIRGDAGTEVVLTVYRQSAADFIDIPINRGKITVPSINVRKPSDINVVYQKYDASTAIIDVGRFTDGTYAGWTSNWDAAVEEVINSDAEKVVLDLRDNPGGYFDAAIYAASEFLPKGSVVAKQQDKDDELLIFEVMNEGRLQDTPLVVLVNEGSASSSEIVAAALQYHDRAKVIGMPTFGKGTAQSVIPFQDGSSLHITVMKWLLPDGTWLNSDNVVVPDEEVDRTAEEFKAGMDPQLERGIEIIK
ncbi:PDZ domain-containing protein [Candidatus Dojkabacteria bacterium]|nr:PDZ domain-containing protein [Candidatus Dojkabacteria bacterium]